MKDCGTDGNCSLCYENNEKIKETVVHTYNICTSFNNLRNN